MKGVFLCSPAKQCNYCGSKLEMKRKQVDWVYEDVGTRIARPTTVFTCEHCLADFVVRGDHVDDSGWRKLRVLLRDERRDPPRVHSSQVHTYYEPTVKKSAPGRLQHEESQPHRQPSVRKPNQPSSRPDEPIRAARSPFRSCEVCEFWHPERQMCSIHVRTTRADQWCKRFKRNWVTIYPGGGVSPK